MTYTFNDEEHIHTLDGKPLMGVTSVLKVIAKPALIQWAANMACDYIREKFEAIKFPIATDDEIYKWLEEARKAHCKKKEKAGDWGTGVHKAIEEWIHSGKTTVKLDETQQEVFGKFKKWTKDNNIEFLESEKHLYSEKYWIGGICDLVLKMNGKKFIGDIKTSSGIYDEAFFQMGAYNLCLEEMGEHKDVEGYIVINLQKTGKIDFKIAYDMQLNKEAFVHALGLYKIINQLK